MVFFGLTRVLSLLSPDGAVALYPFVMLLLPAAGITAIVLACLPNRKLRGIGIGMLIMAGIGLLLIGGLFLVCVAILSQAHG